VTISKPQPPKRGTSKQKAAQPATKESLQYGHGRSAAAGRRRAKANRGKVYHGEPWAVIEMSDRRYVVAADGSFRAITPDVTERN
jgi:hypothetical protein